MKDWQLALWAYVILVALLCFLVIGALAFGLSEVAVAAND